MDILVDLRFFAQPFAEIGDARIFDTRGKVEQHRIGAEVGAVEVEILDRRIGAVGKQRRPMIISAHLHPPFVDTDSRRRIDRAIVLIVAARKQSAHAVHHSSPVANIGDVMHRQW